MTVRITTDRELCEGYGNCVIASPKTFDLDDDGLVISLVDEAPDSARPEIEAAARSCPVDAITVGDD